MAPHARSQGFAPVQRTFTPRLRGFPLGHPPGLGASASWAEGFYPQAPMAFPLAPQESGLSPRLKGFYPRAFPLAPPGVRLCRAFTPRAQGFPPSPRLKGFYPRAFTPGLLPQGFYPRGFYPRAFTPGAFTPGFMSTFPNGDR